MWTLGVAVAAAQAQQQGNRNIIPLMHSLAQFMPQMAAAHSAPQAPSMVSPGQPAAPLPIPSGFPNFMLGNASAAAAPMPWPLVSQPPGSTFQVVPAPTAQPAVPTGVPAPLPTPAATALQAASVEALQPAQPATGEAALQLPEPAGGRALSALLGDAADAPGATIIAQQQPVRTLAVAPSAEEAPAVEG